MQHGEPGRQIAHDNQGREYWWKNGQWEPIDEISGAAAIALGAGKTLENVATGIEQGINTVGEFFGSENSRRRNVDLAGRVAESNREFQGRQEEHPITTFIGEVLPAVATGALAGPSLLAQGAAAGVGGLTSYGDITDRLTRGGIGAIAGAGGAAVSAPIVQRVMKGIRESSTSISSPANISARVAARQVVEEIPIGVEVRAQRAAGMPDQAPGPIDDIAARVEREVFPDDPAFAADSVGSARPFGTEIRPAGKQSSFIRELLRGLTRDAQGLSPGQQQAIDVLRREGITLEPGMASGNRGQRLIVASMKSHPITANQLETLITSPNKKILNNKIGAALGEEGLDEFTPSTIVNIEEKFSGIRSDIIERVPELKTGDASQRVAEINANYTSGLRHGGPTDPVEGRMSKLEQALQGEQIDTPLYQQLREDMRNLQRTANSANDPNTAETYGDLIDVLDEMFEKNVSSADAAAWRESTQGFRLLTALERGKAIGNDGGIRLGTLSNNLKRVFKREFGKNNRFGGRNIDRTKPELTELFDLIKALNKNQDLVGDSGTATRSALGQILGDKIATLGLVSSRLGIRAWIKGSQ